MRNRILRQISISIDRQRYTDWPLYDRLINPRRVVGSRSLFTCKQMMWNQAKSAIVDTPATLCVITYLRDCRSLIRGNTLRSARGRRCRVIKSPCIQEQLRSLTERTWRFSISFSSMIPTRKHRFNLLIERITLLASRWSGLSNENYLYIFRKKSYNALIWFAFLCRSYLNVIKLHFDQTEYIYRELPFFPNMLIFSL